MKFVNKAKITSRQITNYASMFFLNKVVTGTLHYAVHRVDQGSKCDFIRTHKIVRAIHAPLFIKRTFVVSLHRVSLKLDKKRGNHE